MMMNLARRLALIALMLCPVPALAALQAYQYQAADLQTGQPLPGAKVTIYQFGTMTPAPIFDMSGNAISNPMTADQNGVIAFQAQSTGSYQAVWSSGRYVSPLWSLTTNGGIPAIQLGSFVIGSCATPPSITLTGTTPNPLFNFTLPSCVYSGGIAYQGTWNAATNTPALSSGVGTAGNYYFVSVAGTTPLNGIVTWNVGDEIIFNGTAWQVIRNPETTLTNITPEFVSNATLSALPSTYSPIYGVTRTGVVAAGDSPPVHFMASGSACVPHSGAGDVGSQVPTSDGKCWKASPIVLDARAFGGFGTGDDTTALQDLSNAAVAGQTIDLGGAHLVSAQIFTNAGVNYRGGSVYWTISTNLLGAFVAANDTTFDSIGFVGPNLTGTGSTPLYQVGIFGGTASQSGTLPANHVTVRNCAFSNMTVGVWAGADTGETPSAWWDVSGNYLASIGGLPGLSEGYGVILTPATDSIVSNNRFKTIRRHAVYVTGGAQRIVVEGNIVDGIDNTAIVVNSLAPENPNIDINVIGNKLSGFTRSIAYGYPSSVGIIANGQFSNVLFEGNLIDSPLDIGIQYQATLSGTASLGKNAAAIGNKIIGGSTMTTAGIQFEDVDGLSLKSNTVSLAATAIYGVLGSTSTSVATMPSFITSNDVAMTGTSSVAFGLAVGTAHAVTLRGNNAAPMPSGGTLFHDTSTAGVIRSDMNGGLSVISATTNFTSFQGGSLATDRPALILNGAITAALGVSLDITNVPSWVGPVSITNNTGTAYAVNVYSGVGGSLAQAIANGYTAVFAYYGSGWLVTGYYPY